MKRHPEARYSHHDPTEHFAVLEPQNQPVDVSELNKICRLRLKNGEMFGRAALVRLGDHAICPQRERS